MKPHYRHNLSAKISQRTTSRRIPLPNPLRNFDRWNTTPLTTPARNIIAALETARLRLRPHGIRRLPEFASLADNLLCHPAPRLLLIDPPQFDSTDTIALYLRYLHEIYRISGKHTLIIDSSRKRAQAFRDSAHIEADITTPRTTDSHRGKDFRFIIMLNNNSWGNYSSTARCRATGPPHTRFTQICRMAASITLLQKTTLILIHYRLPHDTRRQTEAITNLRATIPIAYTCTRHITILLKQYTQHIRDTNRSTDTTLTADIPLRPPDSDQPPDNSSPPHPATHTTTQHQHPPHTTR